MGDIESGFYFATPKEGPKMLVLADYDKEGNLRIQDYFGGIYGRDNLDGEVPIPPEEVKSLITFDRRKVEFVDTGLEKLAQSKEKTKAHTT